MTTPPKRSFRERLDALSALVEKLEAGELSLEEAIDRYEEGRRLHRELLDELAAYERRLEKLVQMPGGDDCLEPAEDLLRSEGDLRSGPPSRA